MLHLSHGIRAQAVLTQAEMETQSRRHGGVVREHFEAAADGKTDVSSCVFIIIFSLLPLL